MLRWRSSGVRYAFATAITAAASLLYVAAGPPSLNSDLRYFGFTLAVLLSSILGGFGPGLLATFLAAFASAYLILPPVFSIQVASSENAARLLLFVGEGILISFIGNIIRDACTEDIETRRLRRYLPALMLVIGATGLKLLVWGGVEHQMPFAFYYAATAASAWTGGFGPGLAATLLAVLCARYFFIDPVYSLSVESPAAALRVLLFIVEGIALSALTSKYVTARRLAHRAIEEMRQYGQRLWRRAEDADALRAVSRDIIWEWNLPNSSTLVGQDKPDLSSNGATFTSWLQQVHPRDRLKVIASLKAALEEGRSEWAYEYRKLLPGKGYVHVSDHASIIRDHAWKPVRVVGRSADVTAEKRALQAAANEETYRALFESNPHAMLLADRGLQVRDANDAACDLLGYTREALRRLRVRDLFHVSIDDKLLALKIEDASPIAFEEDCVRASGELFGAKVTAAIVSGNEVAAADRIITIEETNEVETPAN